MANKKLGLSFSFSRLIGLSGLKNSIAHQTGIPTTKGGIERKIGNFVIKKIFGK